MRTRFLPILVVVVVALSGVLMASATGGSYDVDVLLPSATKVVEGGPVLVNGFRAGTVKSLAVKDGQALVGLELDDEFGPLHEGAEVIVSWKAALSERNIEVVDGPESNPEIPRGGTIEGTMPTSVEIDDVLAALDAPTRARLQGVVQKLSTTLAGREDDLRGTVTTAGPTLEAVGGILRALGTDGPAIRNLAQRLEEMLSTLAARDKEIERITGSFAAVTAEVSSRRNQVDASLRALPGTLRQARSTLGLVPSVVDETVPLLADLESPTARLRPIARTLRPLLGDLEPLTAELRPTLDAAYQLLGLTPSLMDSAHETLPDLTKAIKGVKAPVAFARPYTPEVVGMLTNWASAFGNYDSNGHFARVIPQVGATWPVENPGIVPPGHEYDPYPVPGAIVGQAWTDAFGSEMR